MCAKRGHRSMDLLMGLAAGQGTEWWWGTVCAPTVPPSVCSPVTIMRVSVFGLRSRPGTSSGCLKLQNDWPYSMQNHHFQGQIHYLCTCNRKFKTKWAFILQLLPISSSISISAAANSTPPPSRCANGVEGIWSSPTIIDPVQTSLSAR